MIILQVMTQQNECKCRYRFYVPVHRSHQAREAEQAIIAQQEKLALLFSSIFISTSEVISADNINSEQPPLGQGQMEQEKDCRKVLVVEG